jgi:hypothetical protein
LGTFQQIAAISLRSSDMIDPSRDALVSILEAAKPLPHRPSPACRWRWHAKGIRGIRLETVVVGGRRFTTAAARREFVEKVTAAANGGEEPISHRSDAVAKKLRAEGLV